MSNRAIPGTSGIPGNQTSRPAASAVFIRDTISGFLTTAHHALMILGIAALTALGALFFKPDLADQIKALSPFASEAEAVAMTPVQAVASLTSTPPAAQTAPVLVAQKSKTVDAEDLRALGNSRQQQWVTAWLSKRYRVAADATNMLVSAAYMTAKELKLDPLLILSVMAIESGFNPFAESPVGAQGLMQVMSKVHHDKFRPLGGAQAALNPVANIRVGSLILKDYVTRGGSVEAGLKLYVGAGASDSDSGYGAKVLAEYRRLKDVAMGKNVSIYASSASAAPSKPATQDKAQTDGTTSKSNNGELAAASADMAAL